MPVFIFRISLLLVLTVGCFPLHVFSQDHRNESPSIDMNYYGPEQGLAGSEIQYMLQDKQGFMWFLTDIALNRYDGYSFRSYAYDMKDPHSLSLGFFNGFIEDKEGKLWIATGNQGLYSFDPVYEKFTHYRHQQGNPNSLTNDYINVLTCDPDGMIWLVNNLGLEKIDPLTLKSIRFEYDHPDSFNKGHDAITDLRFDHEDKTGGASEKLWILHEGHGVDLFNTRLGKVVKHFHYKDPAPYWEWGYALGIKNGMLWIGSDHDMMIGFDTKSEKYVEIRMSYKCNSTVHNDGHFLIEDDDGNLWTTSDNNEIVRYNLAEKKFSYFPVEKSELAFDEKHPIFFEDQSQRIWFGNYYGLMSIEAIAKNIITFKHEKENPASIAANNVYAIHRAREGEIFVGTISAIQIFDRHTNTFSPFPLFDNGIEITADSPWKIYQDSKGVFWFSGAFGVLSYHPFTQKQHLYHFRNDSMDLMSHSTTAVLEDRQGKYWTTSWTNGLYQFDPSTSLTRVIKIHPTANFPTTYNLGPLFEDSKGTIYIHGWGGGFITMNPVTEVFKIYHHDPNDLQSVSHESSGHWIETKNGLIWFGTFGGGLGVFNPETEKFKSFTTSDGLIHNTVSSLIKDQNGKFWAATRGGLSCFTPPDNPFDPECSINFRNYDTNDGLPSIVMNMESAFCDSDGTMFFGTRDAGMFYFHPDDLQENDFIPPVFITGFNLLNKPVHHKDSNSVIKTQIEFVKEIKLNYRQNQVSFTFAALNFIHPEKNKYAYQLEGYDEEWIYTDATNRVATYTNLDPGDYTFRVKGSNNDVKWNENPAELRIIITPPFWQTAWFRILIIVTFFSVLYLIYRFRMSQVLALQRIRNKIASDLHDDIGSTLNSISVYSEVAKKDDARRNHALTMIGQSSRKIIDSMSDIVWTINPENDNFEKIIFRMKSFAHNLLKAKKIEYTFISDDNLNDLTLPMETRRNFYLIFKEALTNLVKYSEATRASVVISKENKEITLVIRDNGNGFDTFSAINGNGISNMKKRASELNARLNIDSAIGKGTSIEFQFKLP